MALKAQKLGLDVEPLTAAQTQDLELDTNLAVLGSVYYKCDAHLSPSDLVQKLLTYLRKNEVEIITNCKVTGFEANGGKISTIKNNK